MNVSTMIYQPTSILEDENHIVKIGDRCVIGQFSFIAARKFIMEDGSEIGPGSIIGGGGDVTLMESSTLAFGVKLIPSTFTTKGKYMNDRIRESESVDMLRGSIVIGNGAYIGSGAVICVSENNPHIRIGDFAVIGALTYIDKDVPPDTIVYARQTLDQSRRKYNEI